MDEHDNYGDATWWTMVAFNNRALLITPHWAYSHTKIRRSDIIMRLHRRPARWKRRFWAKPGSHRNSSIYKASMILPARSCLNRGDWKTKISRRQRGTHPLWSRLAPSLCEKLWKLQKFSVLAALVTVASFYRAMLCIRGTSHEPVSVSVSVSVRHKSEFY